MKDKCPECEYHKARAANWRAETYKLAGYDYIPRVWVGLTDEEIMEMLDYGQYGRVPQYARNFVDAIEAKLKEKNT